MRTKIAILITLVFLGIITIYCVYNWEMVKALEPNEFGDFIAGIGSILAFFWIIFGYFQQGQGLKENTNALVNHEKQLKEQAQQTKELAIFAREQAEAMRDLSDSTKQSITYYKSLAEQTELSNKLTEKLIESSVQQAQATSQLVSAIEYENFRKQS